MMATSAEKQKETKRAELGALLSNGKIESFDIESSSRIVITLNDGTKFSITASSDATDDPDVRVEVLEICEFKKVTELKEVVIL